MHTHMHTHTHMHMHAHAHTYAHAHTIRIRIGGHGPEESDAITTATLDMPVQHVVADVREATCHMGQHRKGTSGKLLKRHTGKQVQPCRMSKSPCLLQNPLSCGHHFFPSTPTLSPTPIPTCYPQGDLPLNQEMFTGPLLRS